MNKIISAIIILLIYTACSTTTEKNVDKGTYSQPQNTIEPVSIGLDQMHSTEFVLTLENKLSDSLNSIYTPTFLYAWQQIKDFYKDEIKVTKENSSDFKFINQSNSFQNSLDKGEYVTRVTANDYVEASAYFTKALPFSVKFHCLDDSILFDHHKVKSFGLSYQDDILETSYEIIYFLDNKHFAIKLFPADKSSEIILVQGIDLSGTFTDLYKRTGQWIDKGMQEQKNIDKQWRYLFEQSDYLSIPAIKFNLCTNYKSLEEQHFAAGSKPHTLVLAYQQTAFELNEKGAVVESYGHAVTDSIGALPKEKPFPKKMIFDKPFVLFIKKKDNPNPYFAMKVMNAELMEKNE